MAHVLHLNATRDDVGHGVEVEFAARAAELGQDGQPLRRLQLLGTGAACTLYPQLVPGAQLCLKGAAAASSAGDSEAVLRLCGSEEVAVVVGMLGEGGGREGL